MIPGQAALLFAVAKNGMAANLLCSSQNYMRFFQILIILGSMAGLSAFAQVTVDLKLDQTEYLPGESIPLEVRITNLSGQQLHFGDVPGWLTFEVESSDGFDVVKDSEVETPGAFDLLSSQSGTLHVDIAPHFELARIGHFKVTAFLHIKSWNSNITSSKAEFDIVSGVKVWSQPFGMPAVSGPPEMREYSLYKANYLRQQLRLYLQLSDTSEVRLYKVFALGPMVSFGYPEEQVDQHSQLHVLWQTGAQTFSYCVVSPLGEVVERNEYKITDDRPKLQITDLGDVVVKGGLKQVPDSDIPLVLPPSAVPANLPPAPPASK